MSITQSDLACMLLDEDAEPKALPLSLLEEITNGFSNELEIGRGGFSVVYKGILHNGAVVAVKRLSSWHISDTKFQEEAKCLMNIKHKNIVRFLGYCIDTKGSMEMFEGKFVLVDTIQRLLCFEYLPKGSLQHYIKDTTGGLDWRNRYTVIKGICEGLNYLHQNKILHLDLKPANILMDEDMMPKIIDFGQSRCLEHEQTRFIATQLGGTMGYLAPELFVSREITFKVDLYSLGVIIKEILTGEKGYEVAESILENWRSRSDISQWEQIRVCAEIGIECTEFNAAKRPVSMKHILNRLLETESTQVISPHGQSKLLAVHQFVHKKLPQKSNMDLILDNAPVFGDDYIDSFQSQQGNIFQVKNSGNGLPVKAFNPPGQEIIDSSKMGSEPDHMSFKHTSSLPHRMTLQHLKDITNNFCDDRMVGRGGSSVVYKGVLPSGKMVAVKRLMQVFPWSQKQFENEINLLMKLEHPNLVRVLGYCYETNNSHMLRDGRIVFVESNESLLCLEYLANGSLDRHISDASSGLNWHTRWKIIQGISFGLQYLHEHYDSIIHLDLKPANILLDENMVPKLADFGQARLFHQKETYCTVTISGTLGYMSPEYLQRGMVTPKSDIFSLGVIIVEVITGHKHYPYDNRTSSEGFIKHELQKWRNVLQDGSKYTLEIDYQQIERCFQIGLICVNLERNKRPTMKQIINMLDGLKSTTKEGMQHLMQTEELLRPSRMEAAKVWMENSLVGRWPQINELESCLVSALSSRYQVISVLGVPGVGKSALVRNLCSDIMLCNDQYGRFRYHLFEKCCWATVSHPFDLRNFYKSLYLETMEDPIQEFQRLLREYRCLIVVDDLQSEQEWDLIKPALVPRISGTGCVIVVITTKASVAAYCTNTSELVFNLKGLEADDAFVLFKNEVFKKNASLTLKDHKDLETRELLSKCGGLAKVIVAAASLLATETDTGIDTVSSINGRFMHHMETIQELHSLQGIFGWMDSIVRYSPDSLKPCIFYLTIFPRDHIMRRRRLVRRWIAEGYARDTYEKSAEETGEKFFSELLEMNVFQQLPLLVSTGSNNTRMVLYQVNGFVHEYISSRRTEEDLVLQLGRSCALIAQRMCRHLIIHKSWDRDRNAFECIDFSCLQSMTVFGKWKSFFISKRMKLLQVLDLEDASGVTDGDLETMVQELSHLKFLSLRGCMNITNLPSSLEDLWQLQTLDVRGTSIHTLPKNIIKLHKLQYVRAGSTTAPVSTPHVSSSCLPKFSRSRDLIGVQVSRGIGTMAALHTLGVVNVGTLGGKYMVKELKMLTQLHKLGVSGISRKNIKKFFSAIECHVHLESLSVHIDKDNEGFSLRNDNNQDWLDGISLPTENLRSLKLYGLNHSLPMWSERLSKLTKLDLEMATSVEDSIKFLGNLPQLCILRVKQLQDGELHFGVRTNRDEATGEDTESYQKIKVLEIACGCSSGILHVTFGSKTMRKLELLKFDCPSGSLYYRLTGLNYLSGLKKVLLTGTEDEALKTDLQNQLRNHPKNPTVKLG